MTVFDTNASINWFRLRSILGRLRLEMLGVRFKINTFPPIKKEFKLKGTREEVVKQFEKLVEEAWVKVEKERAGAQGGTNES